MHADMTYCRNLANNLELANKVGSIPILPSALLLVIESYGWFLVSREAITHTRATIMVPITYHITVYLADCHVRMSGKVACMLQAFLKKHVCLYIH